MPTHVSTGFFSVQSGIKSMTSLPPIDNQTYSAVGLSETKLEIKSGSLAQKSEVVPPIAYDFTLRLLP